MKNHPASKTAYGPMCAVAVEQYFPAQQRLVEDGLAMCFLPPALQAILKITRWTRVRNLLYRLADGRARGVWGGVLCRKRYIDDRLAEAAAQGIQAVVILGAGLDTRAYRLPELASLPVFEVDLPENAALKRARVEQVLGGIPANVMLIPVDLNRQDLAGEMAAHGYPAGAQAFFILEAVSQYLHEDGMENVMRFLAGAQLGSRLVFTYICADFIAGTARYGLDALYESYRGMQPLWQFGLEPGQVGAFLATYSWRMIEQVGSREYRMRYLQPAGRSTFALEVERAVYAEKLS